jgi:hypothetical protein
MASKLWPLLLIVLVFTKTTATSSSTPIVERCPGFEDASTVACVNHYAAVLPYPYTRASAADGEDPANNTFVDTSVPSDPSFSLLEDTSFVIFDQAE